MLPMREGRRKHFVRWRDRRGCRWDIAQHPPQHAKRFQQHAVASRTQIGRRRDRATGGTVRDVRAVPAALPELPHRKERSGLAARAPRTDVGDGVAASPGRAPAQSRSLPGLRRLRASVSTEGAIPENGGVEPGKPSARARNDGGPSSALVDTVATPRGLGGACRNRRKAFFTRTMAALAQPGRSGPNACTPPCDVAARSLRVESRHRRVVGQLRVAHA